MIEIPRHVHKAGGESKIVRTVDELDAALADGWYPEPPPPAVATPVESASESASADPAIDVGEVIADAVRTEDAEPFGPDDQPPVAAPAHRSRVRPRKS